MNDQMRRYAHERANGVAPPQCAILAGYAAVSAAATASRLDSRDDVKKLVASLRRSNKNDTKSADTDDETRIKSYLKPRYDTPLALLEDLMNNPKAPDGVRIDAAKQALPYRHGKVAEAGKKEKAETEAKKGAKQGKFKIKSGPGRLPAHRMN